MTTYLELWSQELYRQTVGLVIGVLLVLGLIFFFRRNRSPHSLAAWASIQSWLVAAPIALGVMGLAAPWPLILLTLVAIQGAKVFFQMMGLYHRSNFVWAAYLAIVGLAIAIHTDSKQLYDLAPMIFFGAICLIPILRNSPKQMIQYISLTLICFFLLGWSFMHLGWIWKLEHGPYMVIYLFILTEVCDNLHLSLSRRFGKINLFSRISPKRNLEAGMVAFFATIALAFGMRHLLPIQSEVFWLASGLVAALGGAVGDLILSVIRRDLGIKDVGPFIIGRGDLLSILDRMIFVAPIFYYVMLFLENNPSFGSGILK
jgi:phosphatidate cytidylyltransferase